MNKNMNNICDDNLQDYTQNHPKDLFNNDSTIKIIMENKNICTNCGSSVSNSCCSYRENLYNTAPQHLSCQEWINLKFSLPDFYKQSSLMKLTRMYHIHFSVTRGSWQYGYWSIIPTNKMSDIIDIAQRMKEKFDQQCPPSDPKIVWGDIRIPNFIISRYLEESDDNTLNKLMSNPNLSDIDYDVSNNLNLMEILYEGKDLDYFRNDNFTKSLHSTYGHQQVSNDELYDEDFERVTS